MRFGGLVALYFRLVVGHARRHRLEAGLCILGVAMGVAVAIAIDAAVGACVGSFRGAVDSLAERSTHSIFHLGIDCGFDLYRSAEEAAAGSDGAGD